MSFTRIYRKETSREITTNQGPSTHCGSTPPSPNQSSQPTTPFSHRSHLAPRKMSLPLSEDSHHYPPIHTDQSAPNENVHQRKLTIASNNSAFSSFKAEPRIQPPASERVIACDHGDLKAPVPVKIAHPFLLNRGYFMLLPKQEKPEQNDRDDRVFKIPIPPEQTRGFTSSGLAKPTPQERKEKIRKYKEKKQRALERGRQVRYKCRQQLAHQRVRYQGRFVRPEQFAELMAQEEAERQKNLNKQRSQPIFKMVRDTSRREQLKEERMFLKELQSENSSIMDDLSILGSMSARPREYSISSMGAGFGDDLFAPGELMGCGEEMSDEAHMIVELPRQEEDHPCFHDRVMQGDLEYQ